MPATMAPESQRFMQFLRWAEPIIPVTIVLFVGFFRAPISLAIAAYMGLVLWPLLWLDRYLVRRNRRDPAVMTLAAGFWGMAVVSGLGGQTLLPAAALASIIPVVFGIPYATERLFRSIVLGSTLVAAVVAALSVLPPVLSHAPLPQTSVEILVACYVPVLIGVYSILVWQSSARLGDTLAETRRANEALRESERSLERKVEERTAELAHKNAALERSQHELADARDEALAASRTKSAFLANMSHELRTPLNAIIGYSEMLREEAEDHGHEALVPDLNKVVAAGHHLLRLINDVLDLSKIEAGRMEVHAERFDLREAVEGIASTIAPLVEKNRNRLVIELPDAIGTMHSDTTKLRQILFNLLSNASKFTSEGEVRLAVSRRERDDEPWLEFRVADTGIGMTAEQIARIFEPFTQADTTTTREFGGTGLGLTITRSFCAMLGGEISATSQPGRGSEFVVQLPAELRGPAAMEATTPSVAASGETASTVLVIDDDAPSRELMARFLAREGFHIVTASSGAEGLRLAREIRPQLITLDVLMPGMDGWSVLAELKADPELADIPVVVVSITDDAALGYALGASEYLTKPVDRERLTTIVRRYVAMHAAGPVLIVEDDPLSRSLLRDAAERLGCRVVEAEDGSVGLACARAERPSLVLLDLMMPVMDGFEFLEELRRDAGGDTIPVVVVTAKDLSPEERETLGLKRDRILEKGGRSREHLLGEVRTLVRAHLAIGAQSRKIHQRGE
jgi:signal transduction histidine kinase/DNA-binding response OmpR family regulator